MTKSDAGKLGGTATLNKHGKEHYQAMGRKGGRPRLPTLSQLRQSAANENVEGGKLPHTLSDLKRLYAQRFPEYTRGRATP